MLPTHTSKITAPQIVVGAVAESYALLCANSRLAGYHREWDSLCHIIALHGARDGDAGKQGPPKSPVDIGFGEFEPRA